eukprot:764141-Hanusia_phi.AAC.7
MGKTAVALATALGMAAAVVEVGIAYSTRGSPVHGAVGSVANSLDHKGTSISLLIDIMLRSFARLGWSLSANLCYAASFVAQNPFEDGAFRGGHALLPRDMVWDWRRRSLNQEIEGAKSTYFVTLNPDSTVTLPPEIGTDNTDSKIRSLRIPFPFPNPGFYLSSPPFGPPLSSSFHFPPPPAPNIIHRWAVKRKDFILAVPKRSTLSTIFDDREYFGTPARVRPVLSASVLTHCRRRGL